MSYNIENLFDTVHDEGKEDYTYLPLKVKNSSREVQEFCSAMTNDYYRESCFGLDWSDEVLNTKIKNVSKVVLAAHGRRGPDILVLQEVENKNSLELLVKNGLRGQGYKHMSLLEGPDSRGIDVAIVSRFPIVKETLHIVDLSGVAKDTRGILQADIRIGRKVVSVFANHWPSQSNPSQARLIAAQTLLKAALDSQADAVIAAGDFNTVAQDDPHGINLVIKPNFDIANEKARALGHRIGDGSHWYRGEWSYLDKILVLKKGKGAAIKPVYGSFQALKKPWMLRDRVWTDYQTGETKVHKVPNRFDEKTGKGYSDHLPLLMNFSY